MSDQPSYYLNDGEYSFSLGRKTLFEADDIALLYDGTTLLKHGPAESVKAYKAQVESAKDADGNPLFNNLTFMVSDAWWVDDLNKAVQITGFVPDVTDRMDRKIAFECTGADELSDGAYLAMKADFGLEPWE